MELDVGVTIIREIGDITFAFTETDAAYILFAHLPGFQSDGIEVSVDQVASEIRISSGGRRSSREAVVSRRVTVVREVEIEGFQKVFQIPSDVVLDYISGRFEEEEAVLVILMPKLRRVSTGVGIEEIHEERAPSITDEETNPFEEQADEPQATGIGNHKNSETGTEMDRTENAAVPDRTPTPKGSIEATDLGELLQPSETVFQSKEAFHQGGREHSTTTQTPQWTASSSQKPVETPISNGEQLNLDEMPNPFQDQIKRDEQELEAPAAEIHDQVPEMTQPIELSELVHILPPTKEPDLSILPGAPQKVSEQTSEQRAPFAKAPKSSPCITMGSSEPLHSSEKQEKQSPRINIEPHRETGDQKEPEITLQEMSEWTPEVRKPTESPKPDQNLHLSEEQEKEGKSHTVESTRHGQEFTKTISNQDLDLYREQKEPREHDALVSNPSRTREQQEREDQRAPVANLFKATEHHHHQGYRAPISDLSEAKKQQEPNKPRAHDTDFSTEKKQQECKLTDIPKASEKSETNEHRPHVSELREVREKSEINEHEPPVPDLPEVREKTETNEDKPPALDLPKGKQKLEPKEQKPPVTDFLKTIVQQESQGYKRQHQPEECKDPLQGLPKATKQKNSRERKAPVPNITKVGEHSAPEVDLPKQREQQEPKEGKGSVTDLPNFTDQQKMAPMLDFPKAREQQKPKEQSALKPDRSISREQQERQAKTSTLPDLSKAKEQEELKELNSPPSECLKAREQQVQEECVTPVPGFTKPSEQQELKEHKAPVLDSPKAGEQQEPNEGKGPEPKLPKFIKQQDNMAHMPDFSKAKDQHGSKEHNVPKPEHLKSREQQEKLDHPKGSTGPPDFTKAGNRKEQERNAPELDHPKVKDRQEPKKGKALGTDLPKCINHQERTTSAPDHPNAKNNQDSEEGKAPVTDLLNFIDHQKHKAPRQYFPGAQEQQKLKECDAYKPDCPKFRKQQEHTAPIQDFNKTREKQEPKIYNAYPMPDCPKVREQQLEEQNVPVPDRPKAREHNVYVPDRPKAREHNVPVPYRPKAIELREQQEHSAPMPDFRKAGEQQEPEAHTAPASDHSKSREQQEKKEGKASLPDLPKFIEQQDQQEHKAPVPIFSNYRKRQNPKGDEAHGHLPNFHEGREQEEPKEGNSPVQDLLKAGEQQEQKEGRSTMPDVTNAREQTKQQETKDPLLDFSEAREQQNPQESRSLLDLSRAREELEPQEHKFPLPDLHLATEQKPREQKNPLVDVSRDEEHKQQSLKSRRQDLSKVTERQEPQEWKAPPLDLPKRRGKQEHEECKPPGSNRCKSGEQNMIDSQAPKTAEQQRPQDYKGLLSKARVQHLHDCEAPTAAATINNTPQTLNPIEAIPLRDQAHSTDKQGHKAATEEARNKVLISMKSTKAEECMSESPKLKGSEAHVQAQKSTELPKTDQSLQEEEQEQETTSVETPKGVAETLQPIKIMPEQESEFQPEQCKVPAAETPNQPPETAKFTQESPRHNQILEGDAEEDKLSKPIKQKTESHRVEESLQLPAEEWVPESKNPPALTFDLTLKTLQGQELQLYGTEEQKERDDGSAPETTAVTETMSENETCIFEPEEQGEQEAEPCAMRDKERETLDVDRQKMRNKEKSEAKRSKRGRRIHSIAPHPSGLIAGSAFIFSLVVLVFHLFRSRRQSVLC